MPDEQHDAFVWVNKLVDLTSDEEVEWRSLDNGLALVVTCEYSSPMSYPQAKL
jgi:hypothetical protein